MYRLKSGKKTTKNQESSKLETKRKLINDARGWNKKMATKNKMADMLQVYKNLNHGGSSLSLIYHLNQDRNIGA